MEYGELGKRVRRSLQKIVPELFHRIMIIEDQDNDRVDVEFDLGELETSVFGEDYVLKGDFCWRDMLASSEPVIDSNFLFQESGAAEVLFINPQQPSSGKQFARLSFVPVKVEHHYEQTRHRI